MGKAKNWTQAEKDYLSEVWGTVSVKQICKNLDRSENAIKVMKERLNLGRFTEAGDYVTFNQLRLALGYTGGGGYANKSWFENRDFPVRVKLINRKRVKIVYLEEFWEWAEKNQSFLNFSKFEENSLGFEPEWAKAKRKRDRKFTVECKKTPWTKAEDEQLKFLLKKFQFTYAEIAKKLCRTEGAVQRRINDLKLKERPIKAYNHNLWTNKQICLLSEAIKSGENYEAIHDKIPDKSSKSIRGYVYRFYLTENLDKVRAYIGNGDFGDNMPAKRLKHMRVMQPEERYDAKEKVSMLAYILLEVAKQKSNVSEEFKDYWQKNMCMNWDDVHGCKANEECCDSCTSFVRIREQYCVRCGSTIISRQNTNICVRCKEARKKQAQRKWAIMTKRKGGNKNDIYESQDN